MPKGQTKSLYQMIKDDILLQIENHQFRYDKPICTEKSLSEQYGVSRITAKRAIEDLETAGILYRKRGVGSFVRLAPPAADASGLDTASSEGMLRSARTIPVILPFAANQGGFFRIVEAATRRLEGANIHLALHVCEPSPMKMRSLLLRLFAQDADSLVLYPSGSELYLDIMKMFADHGKQVIILDKPHDIEYLSSVVCDNFGGGYMLTRHLIDYGHRRIAYVSRFSPSEASSVADRYNGFVQCMKDHGLEVPDEHVKLNVNPDYHMLKHIINGLHKSGVTAIECENDEVAFNVYMCCLGLSIQVPGQMNITGFDNIEWAVTGSAQITSVDQNFAVIGDTMAELLMSGEAHPVSKVVPVDLVPRASTAPAED
ncbi:GntR family transcriptional regulator [Paenibacillus sp. HJL G12]|uniref:GntR family transcriptional regulator n=1 Tax=Paenibacillus dendrobii TaxID=2691084 RepID=A0A7X3IDW6_9BACL|nr:substrate-binding domain-containing protein [Paenibacillus dendrobii]MWV42123.1 GntR family transcriptional regulator [Paenibacillus dendrobii]